MKIKILQKAVVGMLVGLLILQSSPVVMAEEITPSLVEEVAPIVEPAIAEPEQFLEPSTEAPAEPELAPATEPAVTEAEQKEPQQYNQLMRQVDTTLELSEPGKSFSNTVLQFFPTEIKDEKYQISKENVGTELQTFINSEKVKLQDSAIDDAKKETYFNQLEKQLAIVKGEIPAESQEAEEIKIPEKPSSFALEKKEIEIEQVENLIFKKNIDPGLIEETFKKLQLIQVAEAYMDEYMPILADLQADDGEVIINQEIRDLAVELEGNPVKIMNFVRNNIDYESYYGSKKNSVGCLRERVCNDVDTASLTIALMRASGIPARYKKSLVLVEVQQLKELLGVEETQTVFHALQMPIFTVDGVMEFNAMTKLAIEWVHPEIFYSYDERYGNFSAPAHEVFEDTETMRLYFRGFKDNQWLPVEPMMKSYTHAANEIVQDTASFDGEDFWQRYLQYQGELSPMGKYQEELGIDPANTAIQSGKQLVPEEFDFLPYTLPYLVAQGEAAGNEIMVENFSTLPDRYRHQVIISLLNSDTQQAVFSHTFTFSEVNNQPIDLNYEGFTDLDETTIVEHGGIHATPAALVDIKPFLVVNGEQYEGDQPLEIGQSLVLQFEYPDLAKVDQKFSVAGNSEGIFMYFSKLQENQLLDDEADPDRNSKILLEGNAMIAREYLRKVEENTEVVEKYLDYNYDVAVNRAVVTQNRITNKLDDVATTFDFKGLSIDASLYGNGYSNRGALETHGDDFSLLWLLHASYYEAQVFEDLTGLNAISTVTGLQYAYGNPDQYDVITVTQNNSAVIDDLDFSDNTKANMRADLAAGATIITPDRPVQKENWRGIVYISSFPNGDQNYAIGEQAQGNGGDTTDPLTVTSYTIDHKVGVEYVDMVIYISQKNLIDRDYLYQDGIKFIKGLKIDGVNCNVTKAVFNEKVNNPNWDEKWGGPCFKPSKEVEFLNYYGFLPLLTTNGVKFYDPDYNQLTNQTYGITIDELFDGFYNYIDSKNNLDSNNLNWLEGGDIKRSENVPYGYKFSSILGSYLWQICEYDEDNCDHNANVYYVPNENRGEYFRARTQIFEKLADGNNLIIERLGLPIAEEVTAADSDNFSNALSQRFTKGTIYKIPLSYMGSNYYIKRYTYDLIDKKHRELGGTGGALGFPTGDLVDDVAADIGKIYQYFENDKVLVWDMDAKTVEPSSPDNPAGIEPADCRVYDGDYYDIQLSGFFLWGLADTGLEGLEDFGSLGFNTLAFILNPFQWDEKVNYLFELNAEIKKIGYGNAIKILGNSADQYFDDLDTDLYDSCPAKESYTGGKLLGLAVGATSLPVAGVKLLTKVRLFSKFGALLTSGKLSKFSASLLDFIVGKDEDLDWFNFKKEDNASGINKLHMDNRALENPDGQNWAPYKTDVPVITVETNVDINGHFSRLFFYDATAPNNVGVWIVRTVDIVDSETGDFLPIDAIWDKITTPTKPTHVTDVNIPKGTKLRFGIAKEQTLKDGTKLKGGVEQFEIITESIGINPPAEWFPENSIRNL